MAMIQWSKYLFHVNGAGEAASHLTKFWHQVMTPKNEGLWWRSRPKILPHHHDVENLNLDLACNILRRHCCQGRSKPGETSLLLQQRRGTRF